MAEHDTDPTLDKLVGRSTPSRPEAGASALMWCGTTAPGYVADGYRPGAGGGKA
jgi:hypothetical protein